MRWRPLSGAITFDQAAQARSAGFQVEMHFLCLPEFACHVERVKIRADRGGHSAPESVLRSIWEASLSNLPRAIRDMDSIVVSENTEFDGDPRILLQAERGEPIYLAADIPGWLDIALARL